MLRRSNLKKINQMIFIVIVILFFSSTALAQSSLGTQVGAYDNQRMLDIIQQLENPSEQLTLASATWGKLRADYPNDVEKIEAIDESLKQLFCDGDKKSKRNATMEEYLQYHLLQEQIRNHLAYLNTTQILMEALNANDFEKGKWQLEIGSHAQQMLCHYKVPQLKRIFTAVVGRLYDVQIAGELASFLYQIYLSDEADSFEVMVHAEIELYDKYRQRGDHSDEFSRYMASLWQSIQKAPYYAQLNRETKKRLVDVVIHSLEYL